MGMARSLRKRLTTLLATKKISSKQYQHIIDTFSNDEILDTEITEHNLTITRPTLSHKMVDAFCSWLKNESDLDEDTVDLLRNLFRLGARPIDSTNRVAANSPSRPIDAPNGPVSAAYTNNGVVTLFASLHFANVPHRNKIYNGIWGYAPETGNREYALQCNHKGLNILDITTKNIVKVQTIQMKGGDIWRDVVTHSHYAYVAAEGSPGKNNLWVVDLSQLSTSSAQPLTNSNPISKDKIMDLGYNDWGHTINAYGGLLFLNTMYGCGIFDLVNDPMNPNHFITYDCECHDSYVKKSNQRDILVSSDG